MDTIRNISALIVLFIGINSCSSKDNSHKKTFEQGKIINKVTCEQDSTLSYALYIPSSYDSSKTYPVIFAFDAHGDGLKPVTLFKTQAEKFGYILVGSNDSKNGLSWEKTNSIYNILFGDIQSHFTINNNRIYTAGFSGGSRVASSIAIINGGIAGVIGFSAGFPNLNQPITHKFDYLGVVGNSDFNYNEMIGLDKALETNGFNHFLIIFDGKHEWPQPEIIPDVFYWLEFCAYRKKLSIENKQQIADFKAKCVLEIDKFIATKDVYNEYMMYLKLIKFLGGVSPIETYLNKVKELKKSPTLQSVIKQIEDEAKKEQTLQEFYQKAMRTKDLNWWKNEVAKIHTFNEKNKSNRISFLNKRVMSYLSISCYSLTNQAIRANNLSEAQHFVSIYELVDPTNADATYFQAVIYAQQKQEDKAIESLSKSIDQGFNDIQKINQEPSFSVLQSNPKLKSLLRKIEKR